MKSVLIFLTLAAFFTGCSKQKPEERAIRAAVAEYQEAFNQQDGKKMASLWATNAISSNPGTGEVVKGREKIANSFKFAQKIEIIPNKIKVSPDEGEAEGRMKMGDKQFAFQFVYIKEKGKWVIDEAKQVELRSAPTNEEHLQELAWLVGEWVDEDQTSTITLHTDWDPSKNFLTQHFKVTLLGQEELEGQQIIAWDPVAKKIRSWIFDSDGGFGEASWSKGVKSWAAATKYTRGDGRQGTATNLYTPVDANAYTFASTDREIDGEILPNLPPVQVKRVK
jgi:hypothetical protein